MSRVRLFDENIFATKKQHVGDVDRMSALVASINFPGDRLRSRPDWTDDDLRRTENLLRLLLTQLDSAGMALNLFVEARAAIMKIIAEGGSLAPPPGLLPRAYVQTTQHLHAQQFVSHANMVFRVSRLVQKDTGTNSKGAAARTAHASLDAATKSVRDSVAHWDERILGKAWNKPIIPKPAPWAPAAPIFVVAWLWDDKLMFTGEDGEHYSVEISLSTLESIAAVVEATLSDFDWEGEPFRHPPP